MSFERSELLKKLTALAPWHQNIDVGNGIYTKDGNSDTYSDPIFENVSLVNVANFNKFLNRLYGGDGLRGKKVLDVGCNAGAYCIGASQLGADYCLGFDPRKHWIAQAQFLKKHFELGDEKVQFAIATLDEMLPKLSMFDVTIFKGVFYHIPYPVYSLVQLCEHTAEIIIVDTAMRNDIPEDCMMAKIEATKPIMSGVDGLSWYPGGPKVVEKILEGCGFKYCVVTRHVSDTSQIDQRANRKGKSEHGRFRIVGARTEQLFEVFADLEVRK